MKEKYGLGYQKFKMFNKLGLRLSLHCTLINGGKGTSSGRLSFNALRSCCTFTKAGKGPLAGIRIIDFTRILAGPFATMTLGDLGAEVLKIEKPNTGDETRTWGPPFLGKESCYFLSVNRNKKSIAVDLKHPNGINVVKKIIQESDVLVENFAPGVMERLGLGYDSLKSIAPRLIYSSVTGYGREGPYQKRAGYDMMAASIGGLLGVTGMKNGEPCKVGVAMTDLATGLYLQGAIIAALLHRHNTNEGQRIDCDLLSTQVSCMVNLASSYLNAGLDGGRRGTEHESIVPYQAFKTKDGHITICTGSDMQFKSLCEKLEISEISNNEKYKTNTLRVQNRESLITLLSFHINKKDTASWLKVFDGGTFAYAPINSMKEVFSDPQVVYNDTVQTQQHLSAGNIKLLRPAVKFSGISNKIRSPPPLLGEHTKEVLMKVAGMSATEITKLEKEGAIQVAWHLLAYGATAADGGCGDTFHQLFLFFSSGTGSATELFSVSGPTDTAHPRGCHVHMK